MFDIKENLKKLPDSPGVYMHKDRLGQVIYVGKAISLRNRVRQYFQTSYQTNPKIRALVGSIAEFEYITCSSEMEALILECNLIKKHRPHYNISLKDDKSYPYVKVTVQENFPRVFTTRRLM
ncbi:MAG: GIY-YIG nuclease family protein, partial [Eubacterium sp.]|nr:GIY-YIG nuclease family protein [Eubacterium sp.]